MVKEKSHINVVIIGHVDSGKSTTAGHLMLKCGGIDKRTIEKYEKEANEMGKGSFKYAWALDKTATERERGITVDCANAPLRLEKNNIGIVDAPGHKDFIKNMISGTSSADYAILVVPASTGEAETAISKEGSAREHATLAYTLGAKGIAILINKMDAVAYAQSRFDEIAKECLAFVSKIGFPRKSIAVIPISGFEGDNMVEASPNMPWWKGYKIEVAVPGSKETVTREGVTVVDWLNGLTPVVKPFDRPLRIPCIDMYKISGVGSVFVGKVESGTLKPGMMVYICPANITAEAKTIEMHHTSLEEAFPGDSIGVNLKNVAVSDVRRGYVAGDSKNNPPREAANFTAQLVVIGQLGKETSGVRVGYTPVFDCHCTHIACKITKIEQKVDKRTGKAIVEEDESAAKVVHMGESAIVVVEPKSPMCVESFNEFAPLGRFACRDIRITIAVGIIKSVEKKEPETKGGPKAAAGKAAPAAKVAKAAKK